MSVRDHVPGGELERLMVKIRERLRREHPEVMDTYIELDPG